MDLMRWNGLTAASVLQVDQKLLLDVTPPASPTPTQGPPTATPTSSPSPRALTPSPATALSKTEAVAASAGSETAVTEQAGMAQAGLPYTWVVAVGIMGGGMLVLFLFLRKKQA
jgi:hypothetical protein